MKPSLLATSFDPERTVFLVSDLGFQREQWSARDWFLRILDQSEDSDAAFENWMTFNQMLNGHVISECEGSGVECIRTGGVVDQPTAIQLVTEALGLAAPAEK